MAYQITYKTMSKNGIALIILVVEAGLSAIGVEFDPGTIEKLVEGGLILAALLLAIWNQINRPDVKGFILKK